MQPKLQQVSDCVNLCRLHRFYSFSALERVKKELMSAVQNGTATNVIRVLQLKIGIKMSIFPQVPA